MRPNSKHRVNGPKRMSHPVQFKGSRTAKTLLRWLGWSYRFDGLPTPQGVVVVYPHTSNWDFVIGILLKWAMGIEAHFWAKDSLFRIPLLGPWMRWLGGIPVNRRSSNGLVSDTVERIEASRRQGSVLWLAVAPEGTRSLTEGWRTGFYQVALGAQVPVGVARFDWKSKCLDLTHFFEPTGNLEQDFAHMARLLDGVQAARPALAAPVRALIKSPRTE